MLYAMFGLTAFGLIAVAMLHLLIARGCTPRAATVQVSQRASTTTQESSGAAP